MKNIFVLWLFLIPCFGFGQVVDTAAVRREVDSLINLSRTLTGKKQFEEALQVIESAEKVAVEVFERESVIYANCHNAKGRVFVLQRKYAEGEPIWLETLAIRAKTLGKEHPDYAMSLNNLAILYYNMKNYEKAEPLYLDAKAIRKKVLGVEHPDYVTNLNNLAVLYRDMSKYEKVSSLTRLF